MDSMRPPLFWQSKLILLVILPFAGADAVIETDWWAGHAPMVALEVAGLSLLFGLIALRSHATTFWAAAAGMLITASTTYSTLSYPYHPWRSLLDAIVAVAVLSALVTRLGHAHKEWIGQGEDGGGRHARQIAANLGVAMLAASPFAQSFLFESGRFGSDNRTPLVLFAIPLAALAEAAADTVSSEVGQVFGGTPRLITTLERVEPGQDGAISPTGTMAGILAALTVAAVGAWALHVNALVFWAAVAGGVFGLLFDSLLGATFQQREWLNNDAVNFLSTGAAATVAGVILWHALGGR
jgi:uncharacterized protein (TIGR00297 family)